MLDEGVPVSVGKVFEDEGHQVLYYQDVLPKGEPDPVVQAAAQANEAILIAIDNDMRIAARHFGLGRRQAKNMSLIKISCREPQAAKRLTIAMSFVVHEWDAGTETAGRRLHVEIGKNYLKSFR